MCGTNSIEIMHFELTHYVKVKLPVWTSVKCNGTKNKPNGECGQRRKEILITIITTPTVSDSLHLF